MAQQHRPLALILTSCPSSGRVKAIRQAFHERGTDVCFQQKTPFLNEPAPHFSELQEGLVTLTHPDGRTEERPLTCVVWMLDAEGALESEAVRLDHEKLADQAILCETIVHDRALDKAEHATPLSIAIVTYRTQAPQEDMMGEHIPGVPACERQQWKQHLHRYGVSMAELLFYGFGSQPDDTKLRLGVMIWEAHISMNLHDDGEPDWHRAAETILKAMRMQTDGMMGKLQHLGLGPSFSSTT